MGAASEMTAATFLLQRGYEVFRNVSGWGIADLVAWRPGESPLYIDVKTVSEQTTKAGKRSLTITALSEEQGRAGVVPLYVFKDGSVRFLDGV